MKRQNKGVQTPAKQRGRPATTPEARENQLISLAVDLAEQQLIDGTAKSSVIVHYLKLGTMKERLEREKLEQEAKLLQAKIDALESAKRSEELYTDAIAAMRKYSGFNRLMEGEEQ